MNYEEYLDLVVQTIAKNSKSDSQPLTAAALGGLLRQACPDENWKAFGKRSLSELLSDLERQGKVSLTKTDKDALAVVLCDASAASTAIEKFNPLRKSIWDAFVLVSPEGKRFMHRREGTVRVALDIAPTPADDWAEISPISTEAQRTWAQEFIAQGHGTIVEGAAQISADGNWHPQAFIRSLKQSDENLARLWNRFRSAKVSAVVQDWLTQNILPSELAFQSDSRTLHQVVGVNRSNIDVGHGIPAHESEDVRQAILIALSTLPLEKLLEIPIPAGVMLSALSSAKLR